MTSHTSTLLLRVTQLVAATFITAFAVWALPTYAQTAPTAMSDEALVREAATRLQGDFKSGDQVFALGTVTLYSGAANARSGGDDRVVVTAPPYQSFSVYSDIDDVLYVKYWDAENRSFAGYILKEQVARATQASRDLLVPATHRDAILLVGDVVTLVKTIDVGSTVGEVPSGQQATIVNMANNRVWIEFASGKRVWTAANTVHLGVVAVVEDEPAVSSFVVSDVEKIVRTEAAISRSGFAFTVPQYVVTLKNGETLKVNVSVGANRSMVAAAFSRAGYTGSPEALLTSVGYAGGKRSSYDGPILDAANTVSSVSFTSADVELIVAQRSTYVGSGAHNCPAATCEMIYTVSLVDGTVLYTRVTDADARSSFNDGNLAAALRALGLTGDATEVVDSVKRVIQGMNDISIPLQPTYTVADVKYVTLNRQANGGIKYTIVPERNFVVVFTPNLHVATYLENSGLRGPAFVSAVMDIAEFVDGENAYFVASDIETVERQIEGSTVTYAITLKNGRVVHAEHTVRNPEEYQYNDYSSLRNALVYVGYRGGGYTNENAKEIVAMVRDVSALPEETDPVASEGGAPVAGEVEAEEAAIVEPAVEATEVEVAVVAVEGAAESTTNEPEEAAQEPEPVLYRADQIESVTKRTVGDCSDDTCYYLYTIVLEDTVIIEVKRGARTSRRDFRQAVRSTGYRGSINSFLHKVEDLPVTTVVTNTSEASAAARYSLGDVKRVTINTNTAGSAWALRDAVKRVYTIVLNDGSEHEVSVPARTRPAQRTELFRQTGYVGDVDALISIAVQPDEETEKEATAIRSYRSHDVDTITVEEVALTQGLFMRDATKSVYTLTLHDGTVQVVTVPARTLTKERDRLFKATGYHGSVSALLKKATPVKVESSKDTIEEAVVADTNQSDDKSHTPRRTSSYRLSDVAGVTMDVSGGDKVYTVTLDNDDVVTVKVPDGASSARRNHSFRESGFRGFTSLLIRQARTAATDTAESSNGYRTSDREAVQQTLQGLLNNRSAGANDNGGVEEVESDGNSNYTERRSNSDRRGSIRSILHTYGFVLGQSISIQDILSEVLYRLEAMR